VPPELRRENAGATPQRQRSCDLVPVTDGDERAETILTLWRQGKEALGSERRRSSGATSTEKVVGPHVSITWPRTWSSAATTWQPTGDDAPGSRHLRVDRTLIAAIRARLPGQPRPCQAAARLINPTVPSDHGSRIREIPTSRPVLPAPSRNGETLYADSRSADRPSRVEAEENESEGEGL
jgi:hypothetical protein